jgi:hypothetical protein
MSQAGPTPGQGFALSGHFADLATVKEHVRSRGLGKVFVAPTDCILSNVTVVQPDVFYIAADRLPLPPFSNLPIDPASLLS